GCSRARGRCRRRGWRWRELGALEVRHDAGVPLRHPLTPDLLGPIGPLVLICGDEPQRALGAHPVGRVVHPHRREVPFDALFDSHDFVMLVGRDGHLRHHGAFGAFACSVWTSLVHCASAPAALLLARSCAVYVGTAGGTNGWLPVWTFTSTSAPLASVAVEMRQ